MVRSKGEVDSSEGLAEREARHYPRQATDLRRNATRNAPVARVSPTGSLRAESTALRNIAPSITVTKAAIPNTDEITAKMITERRVVNLTPMYRKKDFI